MSAPRTNSRASSSAEQANQHSALLGAATAFGRPPPRPSTPNKGFSGNNAALAAATTVGGGSRPPSPQRTGTRSPLPTSRAPSPSPSLQSVRSAVKSYENARVGQRQDVGSLHMPARSQHSKSPSQQAAALAAARNPPKAVSSLAITKDANKKPAVAPKPRQLSVRRKRSDEGEREGQENVVHTPNATALDINSEESTSRPRPAGKKPDPIVIKPRADLPLKSPTPLRTPSGITELFRMELKEDSRSPERPVLSKVPRQASPDNAHSSSESYASASESVVAPVSPVRGKAPDRMMDDTPASERPPRVLPQPPQPHSNARPISVPESTLRSTSSPPDHFSPSSASARSITAQYRYLNPRKLTPSMTGDQLANAMVASSLASSRRPSPQAVPPPPAPPPRRQRPHGLSFSRTPSPSKGMKHTLRKEESSSSESENSLHPYRKHKKKRHLRKHPNKHNEGERKRWRDAVTDRERKRYEGLWASNRGIYVSLTADEEAQLRRDSPVEPSAGTRAKMNAQVSNIVAREIWSRSRLANSTLQVIWDLVDQDQVGRLSREEFVVGLWLIDQRLKGRKLPVQVSESVWASVRSLDGIKIKK